MSGIEMVALICTLGCLTGVAKHYLNIKQNQQSNLNNDVAKKLQSQINHLNERMATMEKIITDDKYQLDKEIQNL